MSECTWYCHRNFFNTPVRMQRSMEDDSSDEGAVEEVHKFFSLLAVNVLVDNVSEVSESVHALVEDSRRFL